MSPENNPVRTALADPKVRASLLAHALAVLGIRFPDRADEVFAETAVRALDRSNTYNRALGTARAWLHGIMTYVLRDFRRKLLRAPAQESAVPDDWARAEARLAEAHLAAAANKAAVAEILSRLSHQNREMLQLRYIEGLKSKEIAARLRIRAGTMRVRLSRAVRAVKDIMGTMPREDML